MYLSIKEIRMQDDDVLFFVHIPKTAGLSLISLIEAQFHEDTIFPLHSAPDLEVFKNYSPTLIEKVRFVRGHYYFGPFDSSIYKHVIRNPITVTVLRDPVERTISAYRHILRRPQHQFHDEFVTKSISIEDYVLDPRFFDRVVNRQTRYILGSIRNNPRSADVPNALSLEAQLHLAMERIEQFAFVGIFERFEDSVRVLFRLFGWHPVEEIPRINAAPEHTCKEQFDKRTIQLIEERTQLDYQLYEYSKQKFKQMYALFFGEESA